MIMFGIRIIHLANGQKKSVKNSCRGVGEGQVYGNDFRYRNI